MKTIGWLARWALCILSLGCVHWRGEKGLGMYGDANRCTTCGADVYGLIVIFEEKES